MPSCSQLQSHSLNGSRAAGIRTFTWRQFETACCSSFNKSPTSFSQVEGVTRPVQEVDSTHRWLLALLAHSSEFTAVGSAGHALACSSAQPTSVPQGWRVLLIGSRYCGVSACCYLASPAKQAYQQLQNTAPVTAAAFERSLSTATVNSLTPSCFVLQLTSQHQCWKHHPVETLSSWTQHLLRTLASTAQQYAHCALPAQAACDPRRAGRPALVPRKHPSQPPAHHNNSAHASTAPATCGQAADSAGVLQQGCCMHTAC
jgi:hypothetical protein